MIRPHVRGILFLLILVTPSLAQVSDPVPGAITKSGLAVEIEDWVTVPQSSSAAPKARISHVKPMPGLPGQLMTNDMRGKLFVITGSVISEFLDVADEMGSDFFDEEGLGTGLHSFAFHPGFASNGLFYTNHVEHAGSGTATHAGPLTGNDIDQQAVLLEWDMSDPSSSTYDGGSPRELMRLDVRSNSHGMQEIAFNPLAESGDEDYGLLFVCIGDGGSVLRGVKDQPAGAENDVGRIDSPLGSILRIAPILDASHSSSDFEANGAYWIPESNPFFNTADPSPGDGAGTVKELYCYGFRNPHRISWDTGGSGKMLGVCIGQNNIEEVNLIQPGANYGWPHREGTFLLDTVNASSADDIAEVYPLPTNDSGNTYPIAQYDHDEGFAITGGYVYRGTAVPALSGKYLFGDIVNGRIFYADEAALTQGTQAPISELTLLTNNVETTLKTLVGANRADLRFGINHDGEILVLTKTDGKIRRLKPAATGGGPIIPIRGADDWTSVADFETGDLSGFSIANTSSATPDVSVVSDPFDSNANNVLAIAPADATDEVNVSLPIPNIANGDSGTVYLRFAIESSASNDAVWGISDVASPSTWTDFETALLSKNGDALQVRDGSSYTDTGGTLQNGTWYSLWLVADNDTDIYSVSIKGGAWATRTEIASDLAFRNGTSDPLQTFFWRIRNLSGTATNATLYFDDLHVDASNVNLTDPKANGWRLLNDFEGVDPLMAWGYDSTKQSVEVVQGAQSNHYMKRTLLTDNDQAVGEPLWTPLPSPISVSSITTFYWRFAFGNGDLNQSMGLTNIESSTTPGPDDYEVRVQLNESDPPQLTRNQWYECWTVVNNGAIPSGGQVYDVYLRGGTEYPSQTQLLNNASFQNGNELSLTQFFITGSAAEDVTAAPLCLDDLYQFPGETLEGPLDTFTKATHAISASNLAISFVAEPSLKYQVEGSDNLEVWYPISNSISSASDLPVIDNISTLVRRFYRVRELPPGN